jgi:ABC-2 type transport system permease protein
MSSHIFAKVLVVAKDEWRYWLRYKLAISVLVIGLLLTLSSVIVTAVTMMELSHTRSSLQDTAEQTFVDQPDRHPHRMVHYGHYAFRVPSPLSTIDPGVDAFTGNSIFLEGHRQNSAMFADQKQGTALTSLGSLSPAFILQVLAPLLLILIAYSSVSRERESQMLSFIVSQGTSIFTLIIGKGAALLCVVGLIMLPLIASSGIAIMQGESIVVVLSFLSAYILYLLVWSLVVLLVSTAVSKNSERFTALLFVWIFFCIVMPRIASSTASASIVSPGKLETDFAVIAELRKLGDGHNANDPAFSQLKASLLRQYNVQTVEELPINFRGAVARASEAQLTEVLNRFAENSMQEELAQTQLARNFGWLSPMVAIRSLSMISAGTSIETHHRFIREAEDLRFSFVQSLNQVHVNKLNYADDMNRNANAEAGQKARVSAENWQMIQDFEFKLESANARLQSSLPAFAQLFMWIAIAGALIRFFGRRAL